MNIEDKVFHCYECRTGCGSTILMDFKFPKRKPRCPRCGTHSTMEYKGEYGSVKPIPKTKLGLEATGNKKEKKVNIYQVKSEKDFNELLITLKKYGYRWCSGRDLIDESIVSWNEYKQNTCISFNPHNKLVAYSTFDFYTNSLELPVSTYVSEKETIK